LPASKSEILARRLFPESPAGGCGFHATVRSGRWQNKIKTEGRRRESYAGRKSTFPASFLGSGGSRSEKEEKYPVTAEWKITLGIKKEKRPEQAAALYTTGKEGK